MEQPKDTTDVKEFKGNAITPEVTWAQRSSTTDAEKNHIFLSIVIPDVETKNMKLDIQPTKLTFTGYSDTRKASYHVEIEFYAEIDPSATKTNHTGRALEFVLQKKDLKEEFWPRLLKDSRKVHWLKTDFDKWVDEDEQDAVEDDDYMSRMGGMGAGGMPGMGGMGGMGGEGGFGGIDFSKLGGMGGMDGLDGAAGLGEEEEEEGDDEDEEMSGLGEAGAGSSTIEPASGGAKIEEVE